MVHVISLDVVQQMSTATPAPPEVMRYPDGGGWPGVLRRWLYLASGRRGRAGIGTLGLAAYRVRSPVMTDHQADHNKDRREPILADGLWMETPSERRCPTTCTYFASRRSRLSGMATRPVARPTYV
jgi:hypothetical protein